jgi:hypothetical protein
MPQPNRNAIKTPSLFLLLYASVQTNLETDVTEKCQKEKMMAIPLVTV